jgi:hypothetical protein
MTHNITPAQGIIEAKNIQAAMWANRIMTNKINNSTCKYEIAQSTTSDLVKDMEQRVRRYLKAGLVTAEAYLKPLDSKLERLRQSVRNKPIEHKAITGGSKDGLWSK